jgi:hypothetical protein
LYETGFRELEVTGRNGKRKLHACWTFARGRKSLTLETQGEIRRERYFRWVCALQLLDFQGMKKLRVGWATA